MIKSLSMDYFTSDHHFDHTNIIKYCQRPFEDVDCMNAYMVRKWNERVTPEDTVFYLGDFAFGRRPEYWLSRLNGTKILIRGNHDRFSMAKALEIGFLQVYDRLRYTPTAPGQEVILVHDSTSIQTADVTILCGHAHEKWKEKKHFPTGQRVINVGVDIWGYTPLPLIDILDSEPEYTPK